MVRGHNSAGSQGIGTRGNCSGSTDAPFPHHPQLSILLAANGWPRNQKSQSGAPLPGGQPSQHHLRGLAHQFPGELRSTVITHSPTIAVVLGF
jgi:hypothetical protein